MTTPDRVIRAETVVEAGLAAVWNAWTTPEGICSFFAPACNVELKPHGPYEILFNLEEAPGLQGGEGMLVLAVQPPHMLSFTWNAPPTLPTVRGQMTHVVVRLAALSDTQTQVTLQHDGWGQGGEWEQAFDYFNRAWSAVVLPRLQYRFAVGPVDWDNPPSFEG